MDLNKLGDEKWYVKLSGSLLSIGYKHSLVDYSLFTKYNHSSFTVLLIYVEDIVLVGNDFAEISFVKIYLNNSFKIKDLGSRRYLKTAPVIGLINSTDSYLLLSDFADLE